MDIKQRETSIATILDFLEEHPRMFSTRKRKDIPDPTTKGGKSSIRKIIETSMDKKIIPSTPQTVPDGAVFQIMENYYGVDGSKKEEIEKQHQYAMAAEDVVGALLEEYISSKAIKYNLIKCHGDTVKGTDFIKRENNNWFLLQVKNRNNSENSSSASIRGFLNSAQGVVIEKWFRTFALTGKTNWEKFPDDALCNILNEKDFRSFVLEYLINIKT